VSTPFTRRSLMSSLGAAATGAVPPLLPRRAEAQPRRAPTDRPFRVVMVLWRGWTDTDQGFKDYFERRRIPVELIVRDVDRREEAFPPLIAEIRAMRADLVYCWGTSVALGILGRHDDPDRARYLTDVPAIFCNVSRPVDSRIVPDLRPTERNFTGSTFLVPLDAQLATITSYRRFTRLACMYNPLEENALQTARELESEAPGHGFEVTSEALPIGEDREPLKNGMLELVARFKQQGAEMLYVPPDSFLSRRRRELTSAALTHRLPTFTAAEGTLKDSYALMGLVNYYYVIGQLTGWQAEQIMLDGRPPGTMPIEQLSRYSLVINMQTALALDLPPPMLMLRVAEIV
jgi:putative ABC transport system substrate-binding protein